MDEIAWSGQRYKRFPRPNSSQSGDLEPLLTGNVDTWPHLRELLQSYKSEWVKDESKYGHYDSVPPPMFEHQVFEGPDTDVETELRLSNIKLGRHGDANNDDNHTASGMFSGRFSGRLSGRFSSRSTASDQPELLYTKVPKVVP